MLGSVKLQMKNTIKAIHVVLMLIFSLSAWADNQHSVTSGAFSYKSTKNFNVHVIDTEAINDNLVINNQIETPNVNIAFPVVTGNLESSLGVVYVSAPISALNSFSTANKSWLIGNDQGKTPGLEVWFEGVGAAIAGREINIGLPAYPLVKNKTFQLMAKKQEGISPAEYKVVFDYAVWVE